ncbi:sulfite exporter TauE/SafE family protein [Roseibium sp. SCP14]|uniref:sulfite exporter TauE/SafE family protein n=1 Tax=Roseibium sp. SCP14 TaxID=3141375 RepID=UPI0033371E7F
MMNWEIALLVTGALAGGFINGLAGFGTALFALGFWLQFMEPARAVAIVVVLSVVSGLQGLWLVRTSILDQPRRLMRFLIPALFGIPLGIFSLSFLEPGMLRLVIAGFLIAYGGFFTFRRNFPRLEGPAPLVDAFVGFWGGVLGGAASLSGALPTMWCALQTWTKSETRAVLQPFNVAVLGLAAITFFFKGFYSGENLLFLAIALPVAMISAQVGISVFKRLDDATFRHLLVILMFVSGVVLIIRELY